MNVRSSNIGNYVGREFAIYLDSDIFYLAPQQKNGIPYRAEFIKSELDHVGHLCRTLHELSAEHNLPRRMRTITPLQRRFEVIAQTYPGGHAVRCGTQVLTYGELDAQADALALHLQEQGLLAGSFCLVNLEPSLAQVRVILAILKAGCAYLQLDPELPPEDAVVVLDVLRPPLQFVHDDGPADEEQAGLQVIRCAEDAEDLPYGWPEEADIGAATPAHAFATMSERGGVCMSLRTHRALATFQHAASPHGPVPAAIPDPVHFWRVLSEGALLSISTQTR
jgi:hypothetical protein